MESYTTFDPDYPNLQRRLITVKANGTEITGETVCNDTPDNPVEMDLCFTEPSEKQVRNTLLRVLSNMESYKKR